MSHLNKH